MVDINTYLKNQKLSVDEHLARLLAEEQDRNKHLEKLYGAMSYTVLLPGKRLRPIMAIATQEIFSRSTEEVINSACAIEMVHVASLMLDDLPMMDDAEYRRGEKTNHLMFGQAVTVLASAALWTKVFSILAKIRAVPVNDLVTHTAKSIGDTGLVRGQFFDVESFAKTQTVEELKESYALKTGTLFALATYMGATLGGASERERLILEKFGMMFGIAFQIRDDIMDTEQTVEQSGKDRGADSKNKKPNMVSIAGKSEAKAMIFEMVDEMCASLEEIEGDCEVLKALTKQLMVK